MKKRLFSVPIILILVLSIVSFLPFGFEIKMVKAEVATVFESDFEGSDPEWNGTYTYNGSADLNSTQNPHSGSESAMFNITTEGASSKAYVYTNFSRTYQNLTIQSYFSFNTTKYWREFLWLMDTNSLNRIIVISSSFEFWRLSYINSTGQFTDIMNMSDWTANQYYNFTLQVKIGSTDGECNFYKDGVLICSATGINNSYRGNIGGLSIGLLTSEHNSQGLAVDDIVVTTDINQNPVADSGGPYVGIEGSPVALNGSNSYDPDGTIVSYEWDFGDGNNGSGPSPTHTYIQEGNYTITLVVTDHRGATNIDVTTATIHDIQPTAAFSATPLAGNAPLNVNFSDESSSYDGITSWTWNFGDEASSNDANPMHNYTKVGTYNVSLTVLEADGNSDERIIENYVTVLPMTITVFAPQNKTYHSNSIPISLETSELPSWIGYALDNQSNVTIAGNTTIQVEYGHHQIILNVNDTFDNIVSSQTVYFTFALVGDVNVDGKVDMKDIGIVAIAFGTSPGHPRYNPNCDLNGDNKVDMTDILETVSHYGETYP